VHDVAHFIVVDGVDVVDVVGIHSLEGIEVVSAHCFCFAGYCSIHLSLHFYVSEEVLMIIYSVPVDGFPSAHSIVPAIGSSDGEYGAAAQWSP